MTTPHSVLRGARDVPVLRVLNAAAGLDILKIVLDIQAYPPSQLTPRKHVSLLVQLELSRKVHQRIRNHPKRIHLKGRRSSTPLASTSINFNKYVKEPTHAPLPSPKQKLALIGELQTLSQH